MQRQEGEGIVTYIGKCKAMTPHYRKGTYVRCDVCVSGGRRVGALDRGCRSNWRRGAEQQWQRSRVTALSSIYCRSSLKCPGFFAFCQIVNG